MATLTQSQYSYRQLRQLYIQNGGSPRLASVMAAIARAESRGRTAARHVNRNGSVDQGLWQINSSNSHLYSGQNIYDPNVNASVAVALAEHSGSGLKNWTTYKTGTYRSFMPKIPPKVKGKIKGFGIYTQGNYAGTDQGVDFKGSGPIPALGNGVVTDVGRVHIIEGGSWPYVVYRLTDGPYKGHFVYVMENIVPKVGKGARIKTGQPIATAVGTSPWTETGFNRTSEGINPVAPLDHTNPHKSTPAGSKMYELIQGVTGLKKGGGGGFVGDVTGVAGAVGGAIGSGASAVWNFNPFSAAGSAIGDATGIHPGRWVKEALMTIVDAMAIAGGGMVFIFGFLLIAADIGLSTKAGRVTAAVPAGRYIAKGARSKVRSSRASTSTPKPKDNVRAEQRREEAHRQRIAESRSRVEQRARRKKEQEEAERKAYYAGARDAASPRMAKIRKNREKRERK